MRANLNDEFSMKSLAFWSLLLNSIIVIIMVAYYLSLCFNSRFMVRLWLRHWIGKRESIAFYMCKTHCVHASVCVTLIVCRCLSDIYIYTRVMVYKMREMKSTGSLWMWMQMQKRTLCRICTLQNNTMMMTMTMKTREGKVVYVYLYIVFICIHKCSSVCVCMWLMCMWHSICRTSGGGFSFETKMWIVSMQKHGTVYK